MLGNITACTRFVMPRTTSVTDLPVSDLHMVQFSSIQHMFSVALRECRCRSGFHNDGSWNPSNGRRPAAYFYLSTSGLVGKWLYELNLKLMKNCVC